MSAKAIYFPINYFSLEKQIRIPRDYYVSPKNKPNFPATGFQPLSAPFPLALWDPLSLIFFKNVKRSLLFLESQQCRLSCHKQKRFPEALLGGEKARAHLWLMLQQKSFREAQAFIDRLRQQPLLNTTEEHKQKPKVSVSLTGKKSPFSLQSQQVLFHRICLMG